MRKNNPVIVTGATGGIGRELCRMLIADKTPLIIACRDRSKALSLINYLKEYDTEAVVVFLELDLSSKQSIIDFSSALTSYLNGRKIAALVNNAGIIASEYRTTPEGWEMNMGVNYIGVWLLTFLVEPHIEDGGRIVNVISCTASLCGVDAGGLKRAHICGNRYFIRLKRYAESKSALLTASAYMACTYKNLYVVAADPGVVDTGIITMNRWFDPIADILFRPFIKKAKKGALPLYRALKDDDMSLIQLYIYKGKRGKKNVELSESQQLLSRELWDATYNMIFINGAMPPPARR